MKTHDLLLGISVFTNFFLVIFVVYILIVPNNLQQKIPEPNKKQHNVDIHDRLDTLEEENKVTKKEQKEIVDIYLHNLNNKVDDIRSDNTSELDDNDILKERIQEIIIEETKQKKYKKDTVKYTNWWRRVRPKIQKLAKDTEMNSNQEQSIFNILDMEKGDMDLIWFQVEQDGDRGEAHDKAKALHNSSNETIKTEFGLNEEQYKAFLEMRAEEHKRKHIETTK